VELLAAHGVVVPRGAVATTPAGAAAVAANILSGSATGGAAADVVIKAQALTGGRGLGTFTSGFRGGVHMVTSAAQAESIARKMLGQRLITKQARCGAAPRRARARARRAFSPRPPSPAPTFSPLPPFRFADWRGRPPRGQGALERTWRSADAAVSRALRCSSRPPSPLPLPPPPSHARRFSWWSACTCARRCT
jgi:hypothetical protein